MPDGQPAPNNDPNIVSANNLQVLEAGTPTSLIIEQNRQFEVAMEFTLGGAVAAGLVAAPMQFQVAYFFDQLGGAAEGALGNVTKNTQVGQLTYNANTPAGSETSLTVPANTLAPASYRLTAQVSFRIGAVDQHIFAFTDGPVIRIV
jgi:hypothetical protein